MEKCKERAAYRYTWPGRDEDFICEGHHAHLKRVAEAMGFHLQLIPLPDTNTMSCSQMVKEK